MDMLESFLTAFDMLDVVLAVFGAVIVSLWFGRGKKLGGLLLGASVGGLAKPLLAVLFLAFAVSTTTTTITPAEQNATNDYVKMLGQ